MTVFKARLLDSTPAHVRVQVFAGPDGDHWALVGILTFGWDQSQEFVDRVNNEAGGVLLAGDPVTGLAVYGPFETEETAASWADTTGLSKWVSWWATMLRSPAELGGESDEQG